jgi:hypothetical protein
VSLDAQERGMTGSLPCPHLLATASQARHAPRLAPQVDAYGRLPDDGWFICGCSTYLMTAVLPRSKVSATLTMMTRPRILCWK